MEKTALYNFHKNLGAKFVPFAGYEMPIQYKDGIVKEHISTRQSAGFFDVSHMGQLFVSENKLTEQCLEKIIPLDFKEIKINQSKYSFLINDKGGVIDDLIITRVESGFNIILNAACKDNDIKEIAKCLNSKNKYELRKDLSLIALQGPKSETILESIVVGVKQLKFMNGNYFEFQGKKIYITRSGYTGEDGFEISIPNNYVVTFTQKLLKNTDVKLAGLGARDSLRLEAGLCLYGHDIDIEKTPIEAGLKWSICKDRIDKEDFIGGQAIADEYKKGPQKKLLGFLPKGRAPAREGTLIYDANNNLLGEVTSGGFSPSLGIPISMGYIISSFNNKKEVFLDIRGKKIPADIIKLPFIPHNYFKKEK